MNDYSSPERLWLSPACDGDDDEYGRQWSAHNSGDCPEEGCGLPSVEYVLASTAQARIDALTAEVAALKGALTFYREAWSYTTNKRYGGLEWKPREELLDDCGNCAREALALIQKGPTNDA